MPDDAQSAPIPWKHLAIGVAAFIAGYGMTQIAEGYNTVAFHWSWQAIMTGLGMSGLYTGGVVQQSPIQKP